MNKITILFITLILVAGNAFSQSECEKFKTGEFKIIKKGETTSEIERNDSIQVEKTGEKIIKLKIKWIDECTYRLIFLEGNDAWWKSRRKNKPTPDLIVRITKTKKKSYLQESKFVGNDKFIYKSKIKKRASQGGKKPINKITLHI